MRFIASRLLAIVPTLFLVATITFVLVRVAPGDPSDIVRQDLSRVTDEWIAAWKHERGLDRPLVMQYVVFLRDAATGRFGASFWTDQPVAPDIRAQLLPTVFLALSATAIAVLLGVPAGVLAALNRGRAADIVTMLITMLAVASPNFWLAVLLIYFFSYQLGWFPFFGVGDGSLLSSLHHLVLPAFAIGTRSAALIARMTRSAVLEIVKQDFVRTAWAKGLANRAVISRHVLANAALPILTIVGLDIAYLLGGSVIIEKVFSRPGLGKLLVDAIYVRDYPMVQATIMVFAVAVVVVNLIVDLAYGLADPRVRYS